MQTQPLTWDIISNFVTQLGVVKGTAVVFFWVAHWALFRLYDGRLRDRQKEIQRLVSENKEHRDRFERLMDAEMKIPQRYLPRDTKSKKKKGKGR